jgi:hypothetical protein
MALPDPQLGLVISYSYLWHYESEKGQDEGRKDRPCVIILATEQADDGMMVTVVPITHRPPADAAIAIELPPRVKQHLGLDDQRSWIVLNEGNRFLWPGYDLKPIRGAKGKFDYGFLPPALFNALLQRYAEIWRAGQGKAVPRD